MFTHDPKIAMEGTLEGSRRIWTALLGVKSSNRPTWVPLN